MILAVLLASCVRDAPTDRSGRPTSFRVSLAAGVAGSAETPNDFSSEGAVFSFDVQAIGDDGRDLAWDGFVRVSVSPGRLDSVGGETGSSVRVTGGRAEGVEVVVALAYGDVRVWFEDVGYEPTVPGTAECEDGADQDGDGRFDWPDDPGCFATNDRSEEDGQGGVGVSDPLWFSNPTVAEVQGRTSRSPLDGESITIDRGDLVVTRVAVDGLYVTDLQETGGYGHMYLFNFSTPGGVRVCDRVSRIDGIVGEFFGYTELSFPSWSTVIWDEKKTPLCPVPEPAAIDAATFGDTDAMEGLESGLVRLTDVVVGESRNCDLIEPLDGTVDFETPEGCNEECTCQAECDLDPDCFEQNQYERFDQFAVVLDAGAGPKVFVVAADTVPDFDPLEHEGDVLPSVTGTLRQVEFLDPPWLLEPRCPDDVVEAGVPASEACIVRRTEDEDEP